MCAVVLLILFRDCARCRYLLIVVVLPQLHFVVLFALWFTVDVGLGTLGTAPRKLRTVAEILYAWSALDVFVLSLIISILQIRQFAAFIIGDKCDAINPLLEQYVGVHVLL